MSKQQQPNRDRNWYAIHTYAGYENAVLRNLKQRIESYGMEDYIFNVVVPIEKKIKIERLLYITKLYEEQNSRKKIKK